MSGYLGTKAVLLSTTSATVGGDSTIGGDLTVDTNTLTLTVQTIGLAWVLQVQAIPFKLAPLI